MKRALLLLLLLLIVVGCSHKEETSTIKIKGLNKPEEKEDIELKNWMEVLEKEPYKIDLTKLKNPFISPKVLKQVSTEEKTVFKLVGILEKKGERLALLQDDNQKGYIVKPGSKIENIKVLKIGSNYVAIEEEKINIYGEREKSKKILYLKKE